MPWVELNGERKKVACGPCIRGHRSSKCEHKDRVLLEVRKPGRPLSSCPHPPGSCSCERVVINYTIPKKSDCNCSSSGSTPVGTVSTASTPSILGNGSNRVQKPRQKRASTSFNPAAVARALNGDLSAASVVSPNGEVIENIDSPHASESSSDGPVLPKNTNGHDIDSETLLSVKMELTSSKQPQASCCGDNGSTSNTTVDDEEPIQARNGASAKSNGTNGSCCGGTKKAPEVQATKKSCCSGPTEVSVSTSTPTVQPVVQMINSMPPPQSPVRQPMNGAPSHFMLGTPYAQYAPNGTGIPTSPYGYTPNTPLHQNGYFPPNLQNFQDIRATSMNVTQSSPMEHNCNCGDGCACLGCASHPRNNTTTEYIRYYSQFLGTPGPAIGRAPPYQVHNPYMVPNGHFVYQPPHGLPNGYVQPLYLPPHTNGHAHPNMNQIPGHVNHQDPWQLNPAHSPVQATPTAELEQMHFLAQGRAPIKTNGESAKESHIPMHEDNFEHHSPRDTSESDKSHEQSPAAGGGSPTLSPSTFFLQSLELPGCDDPTGTCQCGDGCACVGCLTHGGHNGISLVQDAEQQQESLQFDYNPDFNIDSFAEGPG